MTLPVLVTHGNSDQVVMVGVGQYTVSIIKGAKGSFYEGVGHCAFWEDADRFNSDLAQFVKQANVR